MKLVLIALGALIVLGGGAAGAYFFFAKPAVASAGAASEADKAHDAAKKAAEGANAAVKFVELDAMILPIIDDHGVTQTVSLVVAIEVENDIEMAKVKHLAPRLKDAYIQDMYGMLNRTASMEGGVIEAAKLKARLNKATAKVLGEGEFNDVLLQVVSQRPI